MADLTDGQFADLIDAVTREAERVRENAAYSGDRGDGGAERMLHGVNTFRCGMNRRVPEEWRKHLNQMQREADPEFAEYQRLKAKFED